MVDKLEQYKDIIRKEKKQESDIQEEESVFLFFSFDIVNSSLYKTQNYYNWSVVIDDILNEIRNNIKTKIQEAKVWRILGDEIIFIISISDIEQLCKYVDEIYQRLIEYCNSIDDGTFFRDKMECELSELKNQKSLSLKAVAWIANVTDKKAKKEIKVDGRNIENIYEEIEEENTYKFYEFRGRDIDAGFRLSKETKSRRLILSFELAYLMIEKDKNYKDKLFIVGYYSLKGIWENSEYPIILYYNKNRNKNRNKKQSFIDNLSFDEFKQYYLSLEYFKDTQKSLEKIYKDRKLKDKIDNIKKAIEKGPSKTKYINTVKLELHCVAICINEIGEILCVKRSPDKKYMPNKWEFGCAKANYSEELVETLKKEYKNDFNIDIDLNIDESRENKQPVPLAIFTVEKNSEKHKGIIFMAKFNSKDDIKLDTKKYIAYKMVKEDKLESLDEKDFVPDSFNTMYKALEEYRKIKEKSKLNMGY